jgi:rhamnosyltransferase subunit B
MHLIVSAFGSYGDVLPMVGLGAAMRARGHRVQAIANPYFRSVIEEAGLELLPLGTAEEYLRLAGHPDLWHPRRGPKLVLGYSGSYLREVYDIVHAQSRGGETVIAAHGLDMASRVLHEKHDVPLATVHFAPFAIPTVHNTSHYIGAPFIAASPRWMKAATFWAVDRYMVDPLLAPSINTLRGELGMSPVSRIFHRWNQSPQLVLGMFPDWFGPVQPDWPRQLKLVGFPLWDPRPATGLPADVEEFLQAGDAPIVFAPGSANTQADDFFRTAVEACQRLGRRGILATKYPEQLPKKLPSTIRHFSFVPFSQLLPRAAALVHHGGIGTCAQGLACGLPQVVMPMAYDQLDNGQRIRRLGVGAIVRQHAFRPRKVADVLEQLLGSSTISDRARHWSRQSDGAAAIGAACKAIESLSSRTSSKAPSSIKRPPRVAAT